MPLTHIEPTAALVVIDLQHGIVSRETAHPVASVIGNTARLAAAFREHDLTVALVNVGGMAPGRTDAQRTAPPRPAPAPDWADLVPELGATDRDIFVTKQRWGAFIGTDLHEQLAARGVSQLVFTGVATSIGVESSARSAYDHGYHVVLATDAMTDMSAAAHDTAVATVFPRLGETATTAEVLAAL
ncbi:isochorismatase family protein [Nocardioides mangrovi]|uniref:Isochorismatase family protein n=1 Tax=Nocardioides mangrovi TaxID=2874580 RepID=A0ABS7U6T8_9ACTN|nr:isochorismatase family protein [Nocardioides mangrovi]MBZ5736683.1 isochorismatase family protein [Nocardioides mangrovi]